MVVAVLLRRSWAEASSSLLVGYSCCRAKNQAAAQLGCVWIEKVKLILSLLSLIIETGMFTFFNLTFYCNSPYLQNSLEAGESSPWFSGMRDPVR